MHPPAMCRPRPRRRTALPSALRPAVVSLALTALLAVVSTAQQQQPTPPDAARETEQGARELDEARRRNEEAQAEYYREQTKTLRGKSEAKSLWQGISDNAALIGALTAAVVALITLLINRRTTLRAQQDTQFYEALKRFGDKDSPTVRASAAGLLAIMSEVRVYALRRNPNRRQRPGLKVIHYPYFDMALDQLVTGLLIEENSVVVHSIVGSLGWMMPRNVRRSAARLREANLKLQQDMATHLTEFFTVVKVVGDIAGDHKAAKEAWDDIASLTGCSREALLAIVSGRLSDTSGSIDHARRVMDVAKRPAQLREVQSKLVDAGSRLRQNVALCKMLLQARPRQNVETLNLSRAYLSDARLAETNLRGIDFTNALMPRAHLNGAKLGGACLRGVLLTDAELYHTELDEPNALDEANWWRADFTKPRRPGAAASEPTSTEAALLDERLLDKLTSHYGELSPERLKEAHPSVKTYMARRGRGGKPVAPGQEVESPPKAS